MVGTFCSNSQSRAIGKPRADTIRGGVAELISSRRHTNKDMTLTMSHLELLRARGIAALEDGSKEKSHRVELSGSITTWLVEDEDRRGAGGGATEEMRDGKFRVSPMSRHVSTQRSLLTHRPH